MRARSLIVSILTVLTALSAIVAPQEAHADVDVYTTEGSHTINGREWRTTCQPYSAVQRCRTEILATVVKWENNKFVTTTDWAFNNLTYTPGPRSLWAQNPLGAYGKVNGTAVWEEPGRQWRTECDTAVTGRGGCRTYATARVIEPFRTSSGATSHRWVTKWVFNSMVRFAAPVSAPPPPAKPVDPLAAVVDPVLRECLRHAIDWHGGMAKVIDLVCVMDDITTLKGFPVLPNLTDLALNENRLTTLADLPPLPSLTRLTASGNQISTYAGLGKHPRLTVVNLSSNHLTTVDGYPPSPALRSIALSGNPIAGDVDLSRLISGSELVISMEDTSITGVKGAGPNLTGLSLRNSQVADISGLAGANNLTWVAMRGNLVSDVTPLAGLLRLTDVELDHNMVTDAAPLAQLPQLRNLFLSNNGISDVATFAGLADLPELRQIHLIDNQITSVLGLEGLTQLRHLLLRGNDVTDVGRLQPLIDAGVLIDIWRR